MSLYLTIITRAGAFFGLGIFHEYNELEVRSASARAARYLMGMSSYRGKLIKWCAVDRLW